MIITVTPPAAASEINVREGQQIKMCAIDRGELKTYISPAFLPVKVGENDIGDGAVAVDFEPTIKLLYSILLDAGVPQGT